MAIVNTEDFWGLVSFGATRKSGNRGKWDIRFLHAAQIFGSWSKDPSTQVGAIIVDAQRRIVSTGYNGFPTGCSDKESLYTDRELKLQRVVHAEINAILFAKHDLKGATLYSTFHPCPQCAAAIIQSGIKRVVTMRNPSDARYAHLFQTSAKMFSEAGVYVDVYDTNQLADWAKQHFADLQRNNVGLPALNT